MKVIEVFNPFGNEIVPEKIDPFGGEYLKEPIKVWGVVSGESQGGSAGTHHITLKVWQESSTNSIITANLLIFRQVEVGYLFLYEIPKFSVIEAELFINKTKSRAVMLSGKIINNLSATMKAEKGKVLVIKFLNAGDYGEFEFNHEMQFFEKKLIWNKNEIDIIIDIEDVNLLTDELSTLDLLFQDQKKWTTEVENYFLKELLFLKNEDWLNEDEEPMTKTELLSKTKLESIRIFRNAGYEFAYDEDDIFNGCGFVVEGNLKDGPNNVDIAF